MYLLFFYIPHINDIIGRSSFSAWLASLSLTIMIHIARNGIITFFFYGWQYSHSRTPPTHTRHIFFIHSSANRHLGCFHVLAIVNSAQGTWGCIYLSKLQFSPNICLGVRFLDHMVIIFSFLRSLLNVIHSSCTNLHSHQ